MKKQFLFAKIGVVSTTVLAGLLICGTKIGLKEQVAINNFLGAKTFDKIESEEDKDKDKEYYKSDYKDIKSLKADAKKFAKQVEGEGLVMLKNENDALPLAKGSKISLAGISSVVPAYAGKGSAQNTKAEPAVKPFDAFKNAGFNVNESLNTFYTTNSKKYAPVNSSQVGDAPWEDIEGAGLVDSITTNGDAVIYTIKRLGGEASDFPFDLTSDAINKDYLKLGNNEASCLKALANLKKEGKIKKIIVLLNTANQIQTDFLYDEQYGIDAALWVGTTGQVGFEAIAEVINGTINPSGHLPDTYYYDNRLNPVMANFGRFQYPNASSYELPTDKNGNVLGNYSTYLVYQEGIYVGYRYSETRYFDTVTQRAKAGNFDYSKAISHPFGFGDSYTEFDYSNFTVAEKEDTFECTVDVKNTGKVDGKDAVQIYASKPYTQYDIDNGIEKSAVELVGFTKTPVIKAGETYKANIVVNKKDLRTYDANKAKTYVIEAGDYMFTAAEDSHAATNNLLSSLGYDTSKGMDRDGDSKLVKTIKLHEDFTTYSKSEVNENVKITNLFDHADINKYEGKGSNQVKYLSRNDWEGTFPAKGVELKMTEALANDLSKQDDPTIIPEDKTSYPKYGIDSGLQLITLREDEKGEKIQFDDPIWDTFMNQLTWEETIELVRSGNRMTVPLERLGKPIAKDSNGPCGLAGGYYSDGNNSLAERVNDPDKDTTPIFYPSVNIFAATFDHDVAKEYGRLLGNDAVWAGCAGFYGIGLNTHRSPYGGRTYEYWSEDPFLAGTLASEQVVELQKHGCNAYIKHFALNDQEVQRSGISIWLNEQTFREIYLRPFEYAVVDGGAVNAMAAFNRIGAVHAPGDKALVTDLLRGEWGMTGYVVTDMYTIGYKDYNYPQLLVAGTDIPDGTVDAKLFSSFKTNHGEFAQQMRLAAKRILYATCHSNAMNSMSSSTILVPITPTWKVALYSVDAVVGVLWAGSIGYTVYLFLKQRKSK